MKYCELTLTWEKGRRLKSASNGSESVAYTYEYNLLEQITRVKKGTEEIESYTGCSERTQRCLTDCPWPFPGAYINEAS